MNRYQKYFSLLGTMLIAAALAWGLTMHICEAMQLQVAPGLVFAMSLGVAALMGAGQLSRAAALGTAGIGAVSVLICLFSPWKPVQNLLALGRAFFAFNMGEAASLSEHASTIAMLLCVLLALVMHWLSHMQGGAYPALTLSIVIFLAVWMVDKRLNPAHCIVILTALACLFARTPNDSLPYFRAMPAALLAAALAFSLVPAGSPTWAPLREGADKVRQMFYDYFLFTEKRVTFSLFPDGFQPMGEALGGPADPSDAPVMLAYAEDPLLLRGAIKRTYTTYSWTNSSINNRYLFVDPTKRGVREQIFDSVRHEALEAGSAFRPASAKITFLADGISTLYVPHRLLSLDVGADNAVYYNTSGEVFITRGVREGDEYALTSMHQFGGERALGALVRAASGLNDPQFDGIYREHTALPRGIESGVYEMVSRLTAGTEDPYERALLIEAHLMNNYTYSLDVPYPPEGRDFASYFLLTEGKGYCSYFATAMAVMGRIAGLPTRYVEGYMVKEPSREGTVVTGRNAHAWVEIYFKGIGWITFNPTPGDEADSGAGGEGTQSDAQEGEEEPDSGEEEEEKEEEEHAAEDGEQHEEDAGEDEQTPNQDTSEPPPPEPEGGEPEMPEEDGQQEDRNRPMWLLWLLLILGAVFGCAWLVRRRLTLSDPKALSRTTRSDAQRLAIWYRALLLLYLVQGQAPSPSETPLQFAKRAKEMNLAGDAFVQFAEVVNQSRYAGTAPAKAAYARAAEAYAAQSAALKPMERIDWYRRRFLNGIGDLEQIP